MARRHRDSEPLNPEGNEVKRRRQKPPTISPVQLMEQRIKNAVWEVRPEDLRSALAIRTRQSDQVEFGIFEIQRMYMQLVLPEAEQFLFKRDKLKKCIRTLKEHFRLPRDVFVKILRDPRQFDDLISVLFEGNDMKAEDLERAAYTAMVYQRDRTLQAIMQHPSFLVNQTPTFTPPFLSHKLLHYALKENGPVTQLVDVMLAHPDIDPGTRSAVGDVWATAIGTAHHAYTNATTPVKAKRAAQHVRTLLGRDDVDIHTMDDGKIARVEVYDMFGVLVNNNGQPVHPHFH